METHLTATTTAANAAREFLRSTFHDWNIHRASGVAELLTTELVANVVVHAHSDMTVRAVLDDGAVRIEVDDESPALPEVQHPGADHEHGRGMLVVAMLADRWGTQPRPHDGKTVWFELDLA